MRKVVGLKKFRVCVVLSGAVRVAALAMLAATMAADPVFAQGGIVLEAPPVEDAAGPVAAPDDGPAADALGAAAEAEEAEDAGEQAAPPVVRAPAAPRRPRLAAPRVALRSIMFMPSSYLDEAELAGVRDAWLGRVVDISALDGLAAAVDALYREKGIAFAHAAIGALDPAAGRVTVDLVEARLGAIGYEGGAMSPAYLDYRLGLKRGDLADNRLIQQKLERLSLTDGVLMNADFRPAAPGVVDLVVTPAQQPLLGGFASADNFGKESTGTKRFSAGFTVRSLTGWNDPLSVSGAVTHGSQSASVSYSRVVHPSGTRLAAFAEGARSTTLRDPVTRNWSFSGEIGLNHPFVMRPNLRLTGSASVLGFGERGTIAGAPLVEQDGYGIRLGASQFLNGAGWFVATGQTLTALHWRDRIVGAGGLDHLNLQANIAAAYALGDDHLVALQAAGQLAFDRNTPAKFSFGVAGPAGVRGYDQDVSSSDSGFYARAQIERSTPLALGIEDVAVRPFVFADIGRSYEYSGGAYRGLDLLASAGIGASVGIGPHFSGDIFVAKPLLDANGFDASNHYEVRVGLTVSF